MRLRPFVTVLLLVTACRQRPAPPLEVVAVGPSALERTTDGVRAWYDAPAQPVIELASSAELKLHWVDGGVAVITNRTPTDGGVVVTLERPNDGLAQLELRSGASIARLEFGFRPSMQSLTSAFTERARADRVDAERELAKQPPSQWPWACLGVARAAEVEARVAAYSRCAEGASSRGFVSEGLNRRIAALHWATTLRRHAEATALIETLERELRDFPDVRLASQFHYQQGVFLASLGDLHQAGLVLSRAVDEAQTAGRHDEAALYRGYLAVTLSESGRHVDANAIAATLEPPPPTLSRNDQLALRSNVTWVALRAHANEPRPDGVAALRTSLERLGEDVEREGQPVDASSVWSNLAYLELLEQNLGRASALIVRARALLKGASSVQSLFLDWLEGRVALQAGDASAAVTAFEALARRALESSPQAFTDANWRASLGLAEAHLRARRMPKAVKALADARRSLSSQSRGFAEPSDRVVFLEDRRQAVAEAVEAFASAGSVELAFRLADDGQAWLARSLEFDRRVRLAQLDPAARATFERDEEAYARERERVLTDEAPSLASVAELDAWHARRASAMSALRATATGLAERLDREAPRQPAVSFAPSMLREDEALLEVFRAARVSRVFLVRRTGAMATARSAPELLTAERLAGVRHLFVVDGGRGLRPGDELRDVLHQVSLSFVPSAAWLAQPRTSSTGGALVVGDPRLDLPVARAEARAVSKQLSGVLLEGDAATLEALTRQWSGPSVLHFAGHGRLAPDAPWEARLELARGQTLDLEFVLSRRPQLSLVVLSGCETGASTHAPADGIGLAEAFLASGANHVLATTAKVPDDGAARFVERFYRLGGVATPSEAFRTAALESELAGDDAWRSWKLFGRR